MSTAQQGASLPSLEVTIHGRIANRRKVQTKTGAQLVHVVKLPAPDQFTSPQTIEVRGVKALGQVGDDVTFKARVGGYGRSYKVTDAETGEQQTIQTADNSLTVVE